MNPHRLFAALALAALLGACGGDTPEEGEASGEVLEGTIGDDMLELEQVRTLPPLADPTGTGPANAGSAVEETPEAEDLGPAGDAGPPAGEPADDEE